jgi:hypothetical protein
MRTIIDRNHLQIPGDEERELSRDEVGSDPRGKEKNDEGREGEGILSS